MTDARPRARKRPAPLARVLVMALSATSMFTLVALLAIRGQDTTSTAVATPVTVPQQPVVVYVTDPPVGGDTGPVDPVAPAATDPVAPVGSESGGDVSASGPPEPGGGVVAAGEPAAPAAAVPAASPVAAPAPAPTAPPATTPPSPNTGTGGS
jgi:hypothetical protein